MQLENVKREDVKRANLSEEEIQSSWFREPSRRERRIAAGLFVGFGIFFGALAWVQRGWWFAWVILGLAGVSIWYAGHQARAGFTAETRRRTGPQMDADAHR